MQKKKELSSNDILWKRYSEMSLLEISSQLYIEVY